MCAIGINLDSKTINFELEFEEAAHFTTFNVAICCVVVHVTTKPTDLEKHKQKQSLEKHGYSCENTISHISRYLRLCINFQDPIMFIVILAIYNICILNQKVNQLNTVRDESVVYCKHSRSLP